MTATPFSFRESLGQSYPRHLIRVPDGAAAWRDRTSGLEYAAQVVPAMPQDRTADACVTLLLADIAAGQELLLDPMPEGVTRATGPICVERATDGIVIRNGDLAVRLPENGLWDGELPGPLGSVSVDGRSWFGRSRIIGVPVRGAVRTTVEAVGPCCVQWRIDYRWGADSGLVVRCRWAAGADTILVAEEGLDDSDAAVEWLPFGDAKAQAYWWGGGERPGPMQPMTGPAAPGARRAGRRVLNHLAHIGYYNQWNATWVGFAAEDDRFVGVFSGWGGLWQHRGHMRPAVVEDDRHGHGLRSPIKRGLRLHGIVLHNEGADHVDSRTGRCLLNVRKAQWSDLAVDKVRRWQLDPAPEPRALHLVRHADAEAYRALVEKDPQIAAAMEAFHAAIGEGRIRTHAACFAAHVWMNDEAGMRNWSEHLVAEGERFVDDAVFMGYEGITIFHGRRAKTLAYDLDWLWAHGRIDETTYRRIRRSFLFLGYVFADADYCRYGDFWPQRETDEGIAQALRDEMGDCPVPPNFASEFFTTTGLMAELFPRHELAPEWRAWATGRMDLFLATFFEDDGTYHESINYHSHAVSECICWFYPLRLHGGRDYFADPRIKGSYRHFVDLLLPPMRTGVKSLAAPVTGDDGRAQTFAAWDLPARTAWPADGNSGSHSLQQEVRDDLPIAASVYRDSDPDLAAELLHAWRSSGKAVQMHEHALLTLLTLDPQAPARPPAWRSVHRKSLGVVGKATTAAGDPVWAYLRCGRATHHMDFDQGNVRLVAGGIDLLGDHGYHTHDTDGTALPACATWLHNTVTYESRRERSSGYLGLERAPEPQRVHLGETFDWVVHRIENDNVRDLPALRYSDQIPVAPLTHTRRFLFAKPDCILIEDLFDRPRPEAVFWLHPRLEVKQLSRNRFRSGSPMGVHLEILFLQPEEVRVVECRQVGPLYCLGVSNPSGGPLLALLVPQAAEQSLETVFDPAQRMVQVQNGDAALTIRLPAPDSVDELPHVLRQTQTPCATGGCR